MPLFGGGSQKVSTSPYVGFQPFLFNVLGQAQQTLGGPAPGAYGGERVAPLDPYQQAAVNLQANRALQGSPLTAQAQQTVGQLAQGGASPTSPFLTGTMYDPFAGAGRALPSAYADIARAGAPDPSLGLLGQTAGGAFVGANPYLDATYRRAAEQLTDVYGSQTLPNIQAQFSRAGRTGSPAYASSLDLASRGLERGLSDLGTGIYGEAYAQERANQLAAQQALGSQWLQGLAGQRAATGALGQIGQAGLGGQLAAAGDLGGLWSGEQARRLQAAQVAPTLAREDYFDIGQLGGAGSILQTQRQRELDAQKQAFEEAAFGPGSQRAQLQNYANIVGGLTSGYPTTTSPGTSPVGQGISGALGGLTAGSALGFTNPWALGGLALGGGLLGLF